MLRATSQLPVHPCNAAVNTPNNSKGSRLTDISRPLPSAAQANGSACIHPFAAFPGLLPSLPLGEKLYSRLSIDTSSDFREQETVYGQ